MGRFASVQDEIDGMLESHITVVRNRKAGSGEYKFSGRGRTYRGARALAPDHGQEDEEPYEY